MSWPPCATSKLTLGLVGVEDKEEGIETVAGLVCVVAVRALCAIIREFKRDIAAVADNPALYDKKSMFMTRISMQFMNIKG